MTKTYIVYHKIDFDGVCSAACVYWMLLKYYDSVDIVLIPINHGDVFDLWDKVKKNDNVFMVDFCLPIEDLKRLNDITCLCVIDHHKTAIDAIIESGIDIVGYLGIGIGACFLTYKYLDGILNFDPTRCPYLIKLLAEYDVWNHSDVNTLPLQYGLKCIENIYDPTHSVWKSIVLDTIQPQEVDAIIDNGKLAQQYEKCTNKQYCDIMCIESELDGYKLICVNKGLGSSLVFESIWDSSTYDIMCCFNRTNGSWNASLYTDKKGVDVGKIAKNMVVVVMFKRLGLED